MPGNKVVIEVQSQADNLDVVRLAVAAVASKMDFSLPEIDEIKVAVSEAVTNAVVHGYREWRGMVRVEVLTDGDLLTVTVEDKGVGIADLRAARQHSHSSDPERMGLGFYFMESLMDTLDVETEPNRGTRVRMTKRPARGADGAQQHA